jgi:hypothetical protein
MTTALGADGRCSSWPTSDFGDRLRELVSASRLSPRTGDGTRALGGRLRPLTGADDSPSRAACSGPGSGRYQRCTRDTPTRPRRLSDDCSPSKSCGCAGLRRGLRPAYKIVRATGRAYVAVGAKPGLRAHTRYRPAPRAPAFSRPRGAQTTGCGGGSAEQTTSRASCRARPATSPPTRITSSAAFSPLPASRRAGQAAGLTQAVKAISDNRESAVGHEDGRALEGRILPQAAIVEDQMPVIWECAERAGTGTARLRSDGRGSTRTDGDSLARFETFLPCRRTLSAAGPRPVCADPRVAPRAASALTSPASATRARGATEAAARRQRIRLWPLAATDCGRTHAFALWTHVAPAAVTRQPCRDGQRLVAAVRPAGDRARNRRGRMRACPRGHCRGILGPEHRRASPRPSTSRIVALGRPRCGARVRDASHRRPCCAGRSRRRALRGSPGRRRWTGTT